MKISGETSVILNPKSSSFKKSCETSDKVYGVNPAETPEETPGTISVRTLRGILVGFLGEISPKIR